MRRKSYNRDSVLKILGTILQDIRLIPCSTTTQASAFYSLVKTTRFLVMALTMAITLALPTSASWADTLDRDTLASYVEPPKKYETIRDKRVVWSGKRQRCNQGGKSLERANGEGTRVG